MPPETSPPSDARGIEVGYDTIPVLWGVVLDVRACETVLLFGQRSWPTKVCELSQYPSINRFGSSPDMQATSKQRRRLVKTLTPHHSSTIHSLALAQTCRYRCPPWSGYRSAKFRSGPCQLRREAKSVAKVLGSDFTKVPALIEILHKNRSYFTSQVEVFETEKSEQAAPSTVSNFQFDSIISLAYHREKSDRGTASSSPE
jgi:hypothetical protein